jgi:hypothetical protein
MHKSIFIALAALAAGTALAEERRRPDPTAPRAKVPEVEYRSAFADYRAFGEEKLAPWRESNEAVKDAEQQAGQGSQAPSRAKPPAKPPAGAQHQGHR